MVNALTYLLVRLRRDSKWMLNNGKFKSDSIFVVAFNLCMGEVYSASANSRLFIGEEEFASCS